jgi:hypothetical protein
MARPNRSRVAWWDTKSRSPRKIGWHTLQNGELIQRAEEAGYELLPTTDKNLRYQQNLVARKLAVVVLGNSQWPDVRLCLERIAATVNSATPGCYIEIEIPRGSTREKHQ